ncbi:hypothetical protein EON67_05365 [archaeon]|nr:MAG: hypothetical protein EON67_05365 [archaeon]
MSDASKERVGVEQQVPAATLTSSKDVAVTLPPAGGSGSQAPPPAATPVGAASTSFREEYEVVLRKEMEHWPAVPDLEIKFTDLTYELQLPKAKVCVCGCACVVAADAVLLRRARISARVTSPVSWRHTNPGLCVLCALRLWLVRLQASHSIANVGTAALNSALGPFIMARDAFTKLTGRGESSTVPYQVLKKCSGVLKPGTVTLYVPHGIGVGEEVRTTLATW